VSYYIGIPLLLIVAAAEASVVPMFQVGGLQPNPMLVLLIAWLMVRGSGEAFVFIPIGGIFLGLVDSAPMGTALIALAPLAFLQEIRGSQLREGGFLLTILFTVLMTIVFNLVYLLVFTLGGEAGPLVGALTRVIIPTAVLNVLILFPMYIILWATSGDLRRASYV
jgi:rod shape-determining protein MreD